MLLLKLPISIIDGRQDLIFSGEYKDSSNLIVRGTKIYLQTSAGAFEEMTTVSPDIYESIAIADYDGDGDLDVLLAGYDRQTRLFQNRSFGGMVGFVEVTFNSYDALPKLSGSSIAWGDFDNNGARDFILTGYDSKTSKRIATIWQNMGVYFIKTLSFDGIYQGSVTVADYNNDGKKDILLVGNGRSILLKNSTHDYLPGQYMSVPKVIIFEDSGVIIDAMEKCSVVWTDINNDGLLDIIIAGKYNDTDKTVFRKYINSATINSNFFTASDVDPLNTLGATDCSNSKIVCGDYNKDSWPDIFITGIICDGYTRSAIMHSETGSTFSIADYGGGLPGLSNSSITVGHLDSDGKLDVVMTGYRGSDFLCTLMLRNTASTATRDEKNALAMQNKTTTEKPTMTHRSVMEEGNVFELTWSNSFGTTANIYVYRSDDGYYAVSPEANKTSGMRLLSQMGNMEKNTTTIVTLPPGRYFWGVQYIDSSYNGDVFYIANQSAPIIVPRKEAELLLPSYDAYEVSDPIKIKWGPVGTTNTIQISKTTDDWETPQVNIQVPVDSGVWTMEYTLPTNILQGGKTYWWRIGWLDATGNQKWTTPWKFTTYYSATFTYYQLPTAVFGYYSSLDVGDYDRDGYKDIVITGRTSNTNNVRLEVFRNTNGGFAKTFSFHGLYDADIEWIDIDNDGYLDIVAAGSSEDRDLHFFVFKNIVINGNRTFQQIDTSYIPGLVKASICSADFDNDGDLDILVNGATDFLESSSSPSTIPVPYTKILKNLWNETKVIIFDVFDPGFTQTYDGECLFGDIDNDGDEDVLIMGLQSNNVAVTELHINQFNETGAATYIKKMTTLPPFGRSSVAFGDLDNDGYRDLILSGGYSIWGDIHQTIALINNRYGQFYRALGLVNMLDTTTALGDFNNDGILDGAISGGATLAGRRSLLLLNDITNITCIDGKIKDLIPGKLKWSDYDNNGMLDLFATGDGGSAISGVFINNQNIPTISVEKPIIVVQQIEGNNVTLIWKPSTGAYGYDMWIYDEIKKEYSKSDFTYEKNNISRQTLVRDTSGILGKTVTVNNESCRGYTVKLPDGLYSWGIYGINHAYQVSGISKSSLFGVGINKPMELAIEKQSNVLLLTWKDYSTSEESFEVQRKIGSGEFQTVAIVTSSSQLVVSWTDSSALQDALYLYRVRSQNATKSSEWSEEIQFDNRPVNAPSNLVLAVGGPNSAPYVLLTWSDNSDNELFFRVERSDNNGPFVGRENIKANSTSWRDYKVKWNNTYRYRINAYNNNRSSGFSNTHSIRVGIELMLITKPSIEYRIIGRESSNVILNQLREIIFPRNFDVIIPAFETFSITSAKYSVEIPNKFGEKAVLMCLKNENWEVSDYHNDKFLIKNDGVYCIIRDRDGRYIPKITEFVLHQNAPNPFNPETMIGVDIPDSGKVSMCIFNTKGKKVRVLADEQKSAGFYRYYWDGKDDSGRQMPSGVYYCVVEINSHRSTKKMVMLK